MDDYEFQEWVRMASFAPILLCSIVGMTVTMWKWRQLRRPALPTDTQLARLQEEIRQGRFMQAANIARADGSTFSQVLEYACAGAGGSEHMPERLVRGRTQISHELEHGLGALSLIATLGPLFGLLGTVVGITLVFDRLANTTGAATPQQLAGGIGTALHTTIAGLLVGVLALVFHRYFAAKVDDALAQVDRVAMEMIELLRGSVS